MNVTKLTTLWAHLAHCQWSGQAGARVDASQAGEGRSWSWRGSSAKFRLYIHSTSTCILGSHSTQLQLCCEQIKWRHSVGWFAGIILGQLHLKNFHSYVSLLNWCVVSLDWVQTRDSNGALTFCRMEFTKYLGWLSVSSYMELLW